MRFAIRSGAAGSGAAMALIALLTSGFGVPRGSWPIKPGSAVVVELTIGKNQYTRLMASDCSSGCQWLHALAVAHLETGASAEIH
jgi:hypothetical protein